jgi:hypothetical protein
MNESEIHLFALRTKFAREGIELEKELQEKMLSGGPIGMLTMPFDEETEEKFVKHKNIAKKAILLNSLFWEVLRSRIYTEGPEIEGKTLGLRKDFTIVIVIQKGDGVPYPHCGGFHD